MLFSVHTDGQLHLPDAVADPEIVGMGDVVVEWPPVAGTPVWHQSVRLYEWFIILRHIRCILYDSICTSPVSCVCVCIATTLGLSCNIGVA